MLKLSLRTKGEARYTEAHYFTAFKHNPPLGKPLSWLMQVVREVSAACIWGSCRTVIREDVVPCCRGNVKKVWVGKIAFLSWLAHSNPWSWARRSRMNVKVWYSTGLSTWIITMWVRAQSSLTPCTGSAMQDKEGPINSHCALTQCQ